MRGLRIAVLALAAGGLLATSACSGTPARAAEPVQTVSTDSVAVSRGQLIRHLRIGGVTRAVSAYALTVPELNSEGGQLVLTGIVANGAQVKAGDILAQFDATKQEQDARDAQAKFQDLSHQVADRIAQNRSNAEQRASDLQQAESDLAKAQLELRKAPILSAIDAATDHLNLQDAQIHVADLKLEDAQQDKADAANLRVLELQRDQQQVEFQRAQGTAARLTLRAPIAGMVALANTYHAGVESPAQPGDQLYTGETILHIFDPTHMEVVGQINESDGATLVSGLRGVMHLDAYPQVAFPVQFEQSSPVAVASGFSNPVRSFGASFLVSGSDPRLLPDLSCAIDLQITSAPNVLLVPRAALNFVHGQPFVQLITAAGVRSQPVELGEFNDQQAVVLSGLSAGDRVQVQGPS